MTISDERERRFEERLRAHIDERVDGLDEATREQLRAARRAALDSLDRPAARVPRWLPAGALAASLAMLAVLAVMRDDRPAHTAPPEELIADSAQSDDLELMYADEDLELIEDLEFLQWLRSNGDAG